MRCLILLSLAAGCAGTPAVVPRPVDPCLDGKAFCSLTGMTVKERIQQVIRRHRTTFRRCYADYLHVDPTAGGTVLARFTIDDHGLATHVTASGIHRDLEDCVVAALETLKFPRFGGDGQQVVYPFVFHRAD